MVRFWLTRTLRTHQEHNSSPRKRIERYTAMDVTHICIMYRICDSYMYYVQYMWLISVLCTVYVTHICIMYSICDSYMYYVQYMWLRTGFMIYRHLQLQLLEPWQATFLCGNSGYYWDILPIQYFLKRNNSVCQTMQNILERREKNFPFNLQLGTLPWGMSQFEIFPPFPPPPHVTGQWPDTKGLNSPL